MAGFFAPICKGGFCLLRVGAGFRRRERAVDSLLTFLRKYVMMEKKSASASARRRKVPI
jgi:hypothetical protein